MLYNNVSRHKNRTSKSVQYNKTDYELIKQLTITGIGISSGYVYGSTETEGVILTPNITVETGSPKIVYFDYSKPPSEFNVKPIKILRDFFSLREPQNFIQGQIFSLANATYNYSSINLGATFAFQTFLNDVVVATTTSSIPTGYYSANKFDSIPTISKISSPQVKQYRSNTFIITNSLPKGTNSFSYCGVEINSILEFGDRKFRVDSIDIKSNKEYLVISDTNPSTDTAINMPVLNNIGQNIIGLYKQNISVVSIASTEQTPLVDARWATVADEFSGLPIAVEYLVVAGGGGGGNGGSTSSGAGGAGGFRTNVGGNLLTLSGRSSYIVTVGAGGVGGSINTAGQNVAASDGSASVFATITSAGGGRGGKSTQTPAGNGGSGGGGGGENGTGAAGNTPATDPSQGNAGGDSAMAENPTRRAGGGGGGASSAGSNGVIDVGGGAGGAGTASSISGSSKTYAGGGGGGYGYLSGGTPFPGGAGGVGGGGDGQGLATTASAGTVNTGGGGGGGNAVEISGTITIVHGKSGGSGIVIVRYLGTQRATGGTVTSSGGYTIHTFTSSGTFMVL